MSITLFSRPRSSEMTGPGLILGSLQAAGDVAAAAERDDHRIRRDRPIDDQLHLGLVGRIDDDVGDPRDVAGAQPEQVAQALAVGVHDPVEIVLDGVLGADGLGQLVPAARR